MAYLFDDASSEYLQVSQAAISGFPFAMATWFYSDDLAANQTLINIADLASDDDFIRIAAMGGVGGDPIRLQVLKGTSNPADTTTGFSLNTWHHACGIGASNIDRRVFIDGGGKGVSTDLNDFPLGFNTTSIGRLSRLSPTHYMSGRIAEVGIWNLSAWPGATDSIKADAFEAVVIPALAKGYSPLFFRLGLVGYWPLIRGANNRLAGFNLTEFSTPEIVEHVPKVFYPAPPFWAVAPADEGGSIELVVQDATHAHTSDAVALVQAHLLAVADALHAHSAESVALVQAHLLTVQDATHVHSADSLALTQAHLLAVADASHAHSADAPALVQAHLLAVADAAHAHTADNVALELPGELDVQDATHAHTADNVELVQAHLLSVDNATHGHSAESVQLTQAFTLTVQDATHAHAADNVALTLGVALIVSNALHGHSAGNVALTQAFLLSVADALHAHTASNIDFGLSFYVVSADYELTLIASNDYELRTIASADSDFGFVMTADTEI